MTNLELMVVDFAILVAVKDLKCLGNLCISAAKRSRGVVCEHASARGPWKK